MYYIWWLNQGQCEAMSSHKDKLPSYLKQELRDRYGRPGRGRLWINKKLPQTIEVNPWPDTQLAKELGGKVHPSLDAGGIAFEEEHLPLILSLPGTVTDLQLNRIEPGSVMSSQNI